MVDNAVEREIQNKRFELAPAPEMHQVGPSPSIVNEQQKVQKQKTASPVEPIYTICDIFPSIQFEGDWHGTSALFIRFAGCNLKCNWCDTPQAQDLKEGSFERVSLKKLVSVIVDMELPEPILIVLTGGEPTLQNLLPLVRELYKEFDKKAFQLTIETNGTYPERLADLKELGVWITWSPKNLVRWENIYQPLLESSACNPNEIKIISETLATPLQEVCIKAAELLQIPCWIQPKWQSTDMDFESTYNLVRQNPYIKVSLQAQKWVGLP